MNLFTKLAQANVDHFNNHTTAHKTIINVGGIVAGVVIGLVGRKIGEMSH